MPSLEEVEHGQTSADSHDEGGSNLLASLFPMLEKERHIIVEGDIPC